MVKVYSSIYNKDWNTVWDIYEEEENKSYPIVDLQDFLYQVKRIKQGKSIYRQLFIFDALNNMHLFKKISCIKIMLKKIKDTDIDLIINCNDYLLIAAIEKFNKELELDIEYYIVDDNKEIQLINLYKDKSIRMNILYNNLFKYPITYYELLDEL